MNWLRHYLENHQTVLDFLSKKKEASHLDLIQEAMLYVGSWVQTQQPIFVVKENQQQAQALIEMIKEIDASINGVLFMHEDSLRIEALAHSEEARLARVSALYSIITDDYDICVTHTAAIMRKMSPKQVLLDSLLNLKIGSEISLKTLQERLIQLGYTKVKYVDKPFTFAIRGGVCDVFSGQYDNPIRIELFDIEVDSLRFFDVETQTSIQTLQEATIIFASEILIDDSILDHVISHLYTISDTVNDELKNEIQTQISFLIARQYEPSMYPLLASWQSYETIMNLAPNMCVFSTLEGMQHFAKTLMEDVVEFIQERHGLNLLPLEYDVYSELKESWYENSYRIHDYQSHNELNVPWHRAEVVATNLIDMVDWMHKESEHRTFLISLPEKERKQFISILVERTGTFDLYDEVIQPGIFITEDSMDIGLEFDDLNLSYYTIRELYQYHQKRYRYDSKFTKAEALNSVLDLDELDYVVHRQYGIGRYMGIATKEIDGIHKDFMKIRYQGGDELFVPIEQFHLVRKYFSSNAISVRLSKLGSNAWRKNQERIQQNVEEVAKRLVDLYTTRMKAEGFAYSKDSKYQEDFENAFMYDLTVDQKEAIEEIKIDMETPKPMDRLLCGDVGFGKTEVSIRAAFKAVSDHKQVAFLCPTTILSQQHYRTFKDRFKEFPVVIEVLNRFVSDKKARDILKRVHSGDVDILIGTHRILSKDVKFKDLGFLIIDEEQRFGVEHKERIKELKVSVDVLSLSATPIPRTLQMSLVGLRSLSQLNTPPSNRLPVMTYVIEKDEKTLFDIMRKELNREGQVFYLFNDTQHLYAIANTIRDELDTSVGVVHGQMDRNEIEDVMIRFVEKEISVLVCTTIIETGIDIPNANTIIVDNAHKFGLSQLYQIKGRVGRSDRLAYAYFVVPSKKSLTEVASKRLQAIKEFTQLGSGYKIAMRDLTIRGAGELLGDNQSGFIDTVGIDLYIEMLREAIDKEKGIERKPQEETVSLHLDGYLPEHFANDDSEKLEIYQELSMVTDFDKLNAFKHRMEDRYGSLPHAVEMLLEKKRLEIFLSDPRVKSFKEYVNRVELTYSEEFSERIDGMHLFEIISNRSLDIKIKYLNKSITIILPLDLDWSDELLYIMEHIKEKDNAS
ncbi:transcription-repair coupling factor [Erysipelothrix larvae]|uniref:Transcription-repair-coupling factor n=1 Tax=Erysipelothrix larvae TaxID=1514105 RepID=A0A0X8H275_9FIRM|nr:transcription-repair coupling factor [Erysipelothrix larvae]AMC94594.1 transcription-repair coupling factor [Erysipelothrix larvae]